MAFQDADDAANISTNWQIGPDGNLYNYASPSSSAPQASYPASQSMFNMMLANDPSGDYEWAVDFEPEPFPAQSPSQQYSTFFPDSMPSFSFSPRIESARIEPVGQEAESTSMIIGPSQPSSSSATASTMNENRIVKRRHPRIIGGYPCEDRGCRKTFDTQGAATKHYQRTHILEADRPLQCPHCPRRFLWDKDVRRHIGQMHAAVQTAVALRSPNLRRPSLNLEMLFGMGGARVTADAMFAALRAAMQMKRVAIRIRARRRSLCESGSGPRYIMVTRNHLDFRAIDTSGSKNAMALRRTIRQGLEVLPPDDFALAPYVLGTGFIEECLDPNQLFHAVTNAPNGRGPLHFFLRSSSL
jgi:hypothetical protein